MVAYVYDTRFIYETEIAYRKRRKVSDWNFFIRRNERVTEELRARMINWS